MSRLSSGFRCRLSGALLLLLVGNALGAEPPVHGLAAKEVPRPREERRGEPNAPDAAPSAPPTCRPLPPPHFDPALADAWWERRVQRIAGRHELGLAVGIGGRIAFEHDGTVRRVPASNQKLLLSLALFDRLGPDHRIPTRAAARDVKRGTVIGDLWLIGRGDPTLTGAEAGYWGDLEATTLAELAGRIKRSGISRIEGHVRGATEYFDDDFDAPGWQSYVPGSYVQLPSSLVVNGNNTVRSRPERAAAAALTKQLEKIGVQVGGGPRAGVPRGSLTPIAEVRSRPLGEIVAYMNRWSNNFFAEVLGKALGADVYGAPGTIEKGARAIERWVRENGERTVANDSSGLSYRNRVSPRTIVRMLGIAESKPWSKHFRGGLPAAGEGTLRYRLAGLDVHAKTGSLFNGASGLSGWVRSVRDGRWAEFSILGRDYPKTIEDRIVRLVSRARIRVPRPRMPRRCDEPMRIRWRHSTALGTHTEGRLLNGVQLPSEGRHFFTWDPVKLRSPNRGYRRFATDRLLRIVLGVLRAHAAKFPDAPRVGIGDLSRPHGGDFGPQFGGIGHASHQNGLDADIYYPRLDRFEREPRHPRQIDRALAQDLVDRFVRAGAVYVFVGPRTGLTGPRKIVQALANHDNHMHVRIRAKP
jgi:D-alanyl-D-alanine carboxypeptidase/D-alanyl-D-alanine-endopeptidase (penicillin-binding protein 4)